MSQRPVPTSEWTPGHRRSNGGGRQVTAPWVKGFHRSSNGDGRPQASQLTRLRKLGLEYGPLHPLHFTVQGELHLALDRIKLHRTKVMPSTDKGGVTPAAAFIGYAETARVIDVIKVGDWLRHGEYMSTIEVAELAYRDRWRPGARQALLVLQFWTVVRAH